jgi:tRNA-Thr(GGU) m(6)t(6)A37 methyltransferase TsaA
MNGFAVYPIGRVHSRYKSPQPPDVLREEPSVIQIDEIWEEAAEDIRPGDRLLVLFRFHLSSSTPRKVHPRGDLNRPLTGVFSTCSPRRPNYIGAGECTVTAREGMNLHVKGLDALDGSPVIDIKPLRLGEA